MQSQAADGAEREQVRQSTIDGLLFTFFKTPMSWDLEKLASEYPDDFAFENVQEAYKTLDEFLAGSKLRNRVISLSDALVRMHLDNFFRRCAPGTGERDKETVISSVIIYLETGRFDLARSLIEDIAEVGAATALKKLRKSGYGNVWGHIWSGALAVIEIIVVLLVLASIATGFQTLIVSMLILIYANLGYGIRSLLRNNGLAILDESINLMRIRKLLYDRFAGTDLAHSEFDEAERSTRKSRIRFQILAAKFALIEVIGIVSILRTVF